MTKAKLSKKEILNLLDELIGDAWKGSCDHNDLPLLRGYYDGKIEGLRVGRELIEDHL